MLRFSSASTRGRAVDGWPRKVVVDALYSCFQSVQLLAEEDDFLLFRVLDHRISFVVGMEKAPGRGNNLSEISFFARFVGFDPHGETVEHINRNLHLAVASIEGEDDLVLLAGVMAAGAFDKGALAMSFASWRRDVSIVLHTLSGSESISQTFSYTDRNDIRSLAANTAPEGGLGARADMLRSFLGSGAAKAVCRRCSGRGRRGFIAQTCENCGGAGLVAHR